MVKRNNLGQFIGKIKIKKNCVYCNKEFYISSARIIESKTRGKFCSMLCRRNFSKITFKACEICGNQVEISPRGSITYWRKKRFCSMKCTTKYNARFRKGIPVSGNGKNHWNWKGGKSPHNYLERRRFRREMQELIFKRDNYTCQMCGSKKDLQVDHIQSWSEYVELRFKMENCRTVCARCHYKITFSKPMPKNIKGWGHNLLKRGEIS